VVKYITKRVVQIIILLFVYVAVVYWLMEAMPGSFIDKYIMNPKITPEARAAIEKQFGYDKPAWQRFLIYMKNFVKGDLGTSFAFYPRKVFDIIKERLPRTVFLFVTATLISYVIGFNLGKRIAWNRGKISDKVATFVGIVFWTIFTPILAIFNIWLFAIVLKGLTARGIFLFILTAIFAYIAGNSTARRLVEKKEAPSLKSAVIISLLWVGVFVAVVLSAKDGYLGYFAKSVFLPTIIFYLIGYSIGAKAAKKLIRIYGYGFEKEGKAETALWTAVIPILMVLVMAAIDIIVKYIPLNQFINPELWRSAPFSSQYIFIKLLWSALFIIIAVIAAFAVQASLKTVKSKRIAFWSIIVLSLIAIGTWWATASYVDPKTHETFRLGRYAVDIIMHMILPIITLTVLSFAGSMLVMRDTMLEIIKEDYITTAKAKGLPDKVVRDKHAARNALLPLITNFVISLGFTVSGGIITETMFSWPGMGLAYLQALNEQDVPLLTGLLTFTGIFVLFAHLVADILYAFLDPRIRY